MSIETIHHNITYDTEGFDKDCMGLSVLWDDKDETLDDLMNNEHHPKIGKKMNLMWIEKIKEMSNWKLGEKLYIFTKSNSDYNFNCWFSKKQDEFGYFDFIVGKNGYVSVRYFNNYVWDEDDKDEIKTSIMLRAESVYNDMTCKYQKKYNIINNDILCMI